MADFIVIAVIIVFVVLAVRSYIKQRKRGGGCSGSCANCSRNCHNGDEETKN